MRYARPAILVALLVLAPWPAAAAESGFAEDAADAFVRLKRAALAGEPAVAFPQALADASRVPSDAAADAWSRASDASPSRLALLRAEAALLDLAWRNALLAQEADDAAAASAWLALALSRIDWEPRGLPAAPLLAGDVAREPLEEALRAAVAVRAREEVVQATLLRRAGMAGEADASAEGAVALLALLLPLAQDLPGGLRPPFLENATVPVRAQEPPTGLVAPLTAMEYGRDVERLDELGVRISDAAFVAARAAREDPALASTLAREAAAAYAADRGPLYVAGEGTLEDVDAAWEALRAAASGDDASALARAAGAIHAALRPVALLERGVVLKVETGGVQPGREHLYAVWLVRPPLEGLSSWRVVIAYDADVLSVGAVTPRAAADGLASRLDEGRVTLTYDGEPQRRSALLAHLHLHATGAPGSRTPLRITEASFAEPDGDAAEVFLLRDGAAEVAVLELGGEEEDVASAAAERERRATPLPWVAALASLALVACRRRR